jgi:hypothetical protein
MRILLPLLGMTALLLAESVAGLRWTAPAAWKNQGSRPMRAATYAVSPVSGDTEPAECVIYFFGAGQGGDVAANIERWKGQFRGPGGRAPEAQVNRRTINGLPVTTIDTSGEYTGTGGPMTRAETVKPGYRMLAAVVEGPGGNVFAKFTGPARTVSANEASFGKLLDSFQKETR